jgi:hypothetical protein
MDTLEQEPVAPLPDQLMRVYSKMREKLVEMQADVTKLELSMRTIKTALLAHCKTNGIESIRTPYGLAYRTTRTIYSTADWESFHKFVLDNDAPFLLEKKLHQGNVKEFLTDNPELIPPGLNSSSEYTITIKRK